MTRSHGQLHPAEQRAACAGCYGFSRPCRCSCHAADAPADVATIREYALRAYMALADSGFPEFGAEVRMAICDTAGDALASDGFTFDHEALRQAAEVLA